MRSIRIKTIVAILFLSLAVTTVCGFLPGLFQPAFAAKTEAETVLPDGVYELNVELWQAGIDDKGDAQLEIFSVQKVVVELTNSDAQLFSVLVDPLQLIGVEAMPKDPAFKKAIKKSPLKKADLEKTAKLFPEALIALVPEEAADFGFVNIEYELDKNVSALIAEAEHWLPVSILFDGQDEENAYQYYLKLDWTSLSAADSENLDGDAVAIEAVLPEESTGPEAETFLPDENVAAQGRITTGNETALQKAAPDVTTLYFFLTGLDEAAAQNEAIAQNAETIQNAKTAQYAVAAQNPAKVIRVAFPEESFEDHSAKAPESAPPVTKKNDPDAADDDGIILQDLEDDPVLALQDLGEDDDSNLALQDLDEEDPALDLQDLDDEDYDDGDDDDDPDLGLDEAEDDDEDADADDDEEYYDAFFDIGDEIMELEDDKTGIIIQYADGSIPNEPDDLDIAVKEVKTGASYTVVSSNANTRGKKFSVYNIRLTDGTKDYTPTTRALVYVPIPSGWDGTKMIAYLVGGDGALTALEGGLEDDYFVFSTTSWGDFAIVEDTIVHNKAVDYDDGEEEEEETTTRYPASNYTTSPTTGVTTPNAKTGDTANLTLWIILAAAAVVVVIIAIIYLKKKQKDGNK